VTLLYMRIHGCSESMKSAHRDSLTEFSLEFF
jgi:hypothetical protein